MILEIIMSKIERTFNIYMRSKKVTLKKEFINKAFNFYSNNKVLFIHIPKTAGVSLHYGLFERDSFGHIPYTDFQILYGNKKLNNLFKFCFVRNPYERVFSAYHYIKRGGRGKPLDLEYFNILSKCENFEIFIKEFLERKEIREMEHFRTQSYYLRNKNNLILDMDFIGRFETLDEDYKFLIKKIKGKTEQLPSKNLNKTKPIFSLSKEQKDIIYKIYEEDFINFKYQR